MYRIKYDSTHSAVKRKCEVVEILEIRDYNGHPQWLNPLGICLDISDENGTP